MAFGWVGVTVPLAVVSAFIPADRASVRNPRESAHRNRIVRTLADKRLIPVCHARRIA